MERVYVIDSSTAVSRAYGRELGPQGHMRAGLHIEENGEVAGMFETAIRLR
jgi:hypothetical protein